MTKNDVIKRLKEYLDDNHMSYETAVDNGCIQLRMTFQADHSPDQIVEACIWFYKECAELRCYYSSLGAMLCKKSEYRSRLLRLINFINARVYLACGDSNGLYEPHTLYTPRMYITEDGYYDITVTTIINYDFVEVAPIETFDYLTGYNPELLDRFAYPIFGVLVGSITEEEAIAYIKQNVLKDNEPCGNNPTRIT